MDIKKAVERLLQKHNTNNPFVIDNNLGVNIIHSDLKSTFGFFNKYKRSKFIHINNKLPKSLEIFVCAHELGHAIHHPDVNTPFLKAYTLLSTDQIEREANTVAVELLMPDIVCNENTSIYDIARSVGIPDKLVELKHISLDI